MCAIRVDSMVASPADHIAVLDCTQPWNATPDVVLSLSDIHKQLQPQEAELTWPKTWRDSLKNSVRDWEDWQLPVPRADEFWRTGVASEGLADLRHELTGLAPSLLALSAAVPSTFKLWKLAGQQLGCFQLWNDWLSRHATEVARSQLAADMSSVHDGVLTERSQDGQSPMPSFPTRLERKFPLRRSMFTQSLAALQLQQAGAGGFWVKRYASWWSFYASVGLTQQARMQETLASSNPVLPSVSQFLLARASTSLFWPTMLLAAHNVGLPSLPPSLYSSLLPVLGIAAALSAVQGDISRHVDGTSTSPLDTVSVFGADVAQLLRDSLAMMFAEAAERVLASVEDPAQVEAVLRLARTVMEGIMVWSNAAQRFHREQPPATSLPSEDGRKADVEVPIKGSSNTSMSVPAWIRVEVEVALQHSSEW